MLYPQLLQRERADPVPESSSLKRVLVIPDLLRYITEFM
jgi:hypothetical protein